MRVDIGEVPFSVMTLDAAINAVLAPRAAESVEHPPEHRRRGRAIYFCNAFNVALASRDRGYADLLRGGDYVFSDGVPITWVGRRAHPELAPSWERVYGPDVMRGVLAQSAGGRGAHYLLGGSPETLVALQEQIARTYPHAQIAGADSPPFRQATAAELAERDERIRASGATHVWVGLGTPRQDIEVHRLADSLPVTALAVGAAFDFIAGTKPQAPEWMQRHGLEWAFRLGSEPRRLGRRYVWGNSVFAVEAVRTLRSARRSSRTTSGG